jgi:hypothetical protein
MSGDYDTSGIQVIPSATDMYGLIAQIEVRPAMYIGEATISALKCFLDGYLFACFLKDVDEDLSPPWQDFHKFVRIRTNFFESTGGWCHMLLHHHSGDEERALAAFFEMFGAFIGTQKAALTVCHVTNILK